MVLESQYSGFDRHSLPGVLGYGGLLVRVRVRARLGLNVVGYGFSMVPFLDLVSSLAMQNPIYWGGNMNGQ